MWEYYNNHKVHFS